MCIRFCLRAGAAYGCLLIILSAVVVGAVLARMAQAAKHLRGLIALPRVASIRNRVSRVLCHHKLYLESEPLDVAYVLQHSYETDGCEETKFIGVYRSREAADLAMQRIRPTPGFRDHPNGFSIDEYRLDEDNWVEGFVND